MGSTKLKLEALFRGLRPDTQRFLVSHLRPRIQYLEEVVQQKTGKVKNNGHEREYVALKQGLSVLCGNDAPLQKRNSGLYDQAVRYITLYMNR